MMILRILLASILLSLGSLTESSSNKPFLDLEFPAAKAKAMAEGKLLLVHFDSGYAGPDRRMDKETWADEQVRSWLGEHAIAIQVMNENERELFSQFQIKATPTLLFLRNGKEFDRSVGFMSKADFMHWGSEVQAGRKANEELLQLSASLAQGSDLDQRHSVAKELLKLDLSIQALMHYQWLWDASRHDPQWEQKRIAELLPEIVRFCDTNSVAKFAFFKLLDGPRFHGDSKLVPDYLDWQEWSLLCSAFGQRTRIIRWYEKIRDDRGRLFADQATQVPALFMLDEVFAELHQARRPEDALKLLGDPVQHADALRTNYRESLKAIGEYDAETQRELSKSFASDLSLGLCRIYGVLLSNEKFYQADRVAKVLIATLDTAESRLNLVRYGLHATDTSHRYFWKLLREAEATGAKAAEIRSYMEERDASADKMVGG